MGAGVTSALGDPCYETATVGTVWTAPSPVWAFGLVAVLVSAGTLALGRVGLGAH